jgi:hypothetical protein
MATKKITQFNSLAQIDLASATDVLPIVDVNIPETKKITAKALVGGSMADLIATWNNVATTFNGIKLDVTDTASAAASKLIDLQVGGVTKFNVTKDGNTTIAGTLGVTGATTLSAALTVNPANAAISLAPTGTGTVTINPAAAGTMNNVAIGGSTAAAGAFTTLSASSTSTLTGAATFKSSARSDSPTAGIGYATGAGGTATQTTSKSQGVTLDKICGTITMDAATLNRETAVSFTLTNSAIAATDVVIVNIKSGATVNAYNVAVTAVAAGSCRIQLHNLLGGTDLSEAVVLQFAVIKAVTA